MAFWDWKRWEEELDWMALHGINLPLAAVGHECVWRNLLLRLGFSKQQINDFIAGPAFLAWWEMNNLEGSGGPNPDNWYKQQEDLQKISKLSILTQLLTYSVTLQRTQAQNQEHFLQQVMTDTMYSLRHLLLQKKTLTSFLA